MAARFGDLPLVGVSRNAYNLSLLYDYEQVLRAHCL